MSPSELEIDSKLDHASPVVVRNRPLDVLLIEDNSDDALLLVFVSHAYDASDDIRDYGKFLNLVRVHDAEAAERWLPPRRAA